MGARQFWGYDERGSISRGANPGQTASFRQTAPETWCQSRGLTAHFWPSAPKRLSTIGQGARSVPFPTCYAENSLMSHIEITLPDGSKQSVAAETRPIDIARGISPRLADAAIAAKVNGEMFDLTRPI